jgi:hypothetical protein
MGLRRDVPSTSKPATCAVLVDEDTRAKCGKEAHITIEGKVEVMGKLINVKKLICDEHYEIIKDRNAAYSTDS